MIVVENPTEWLIVTQADHARLAAEIVRLFPAEAIARHPRRDLLLEAIAAHDDGWWEADAAPTLDPETGGPADFRTLPPERRREIWRRSVERHAARAPYVAAMAAGHLLRLLLTWGSAGWQDFLAELAARRDQLVAEGELDPAALAHDDAWLRIADDLSLAVAAQEASFLAAHPWRAELAADEGFVELRLDPFPLAGATRFELPARRISRRRYHDAAELGLALATARWQRFPLRLAPR